MSGSVPPLLLATAVLSLACDAAAPSPFLAMGIWGGDHVALTVKDTSSTVEFDCAHGTIDQPLELDSRGHFDVGGTFAREGGPIRLDPPPNSHPARYTGTTNGRTMTLSVTITDQPQTIGPYSLTYGATARLVKCL